METNSKARWLALVLALSGGILAAYYYFGLADTFTLQQLKTHGSLGVDYFQEHRYFATLIFLIFYFSVSVLPLPLVAFCTITSGMLFGLVYGVIIASIVTTLGGLVCFIGTKYLARDFVEGRYGQALKWVDMEMSASSFVYASCIRLLPGMPFFVVNVALGLTQISLARFIVTTCLGTLPTLVIFVNAGTQLSNIRSIHDVLSIGLLVSMAVLGLLPFISRFAERLINRYA